MNNNMFSKAAVWLVIALVLFTVFKQFDKPRVQEGVSYSQFMDDAKNGKVKNVIVQGRNLTVTPADGQKYQIVSPGDIWMVGDLMKYGVQVSGKADDEPNALVSALYYLGPTILIIGFWFYMMRQMQGGGKGGAFSFGKSRARLIDENNNAINFTDVAGCDEAKEEVSELVDFLRDPQKFQKLGGRIPRGVLLVGPPGTGKTLLARAIAGEAKVPFFSISGSDFVEMFVGVGAARVRDMFEQAKKHAPCIVFIDEIRTRDAEERHLGFARNRASKQGLAGPRRADQQHAARDTPAEFLEFLGIAQEIDEFRDFFFGLVATCDVGEVDRVIVLVDQPRSRLAEREGAAFAAPLHLPHHVEPETDDQDRRPQVIQRRDQCVRFVFRFRGDRDAVLHQIADHPDVARRHQGVFGSVRR